MEESGDPRPVSGSALRNLSSPLDGERPVRQIPSGNALVAVRDSGGYAGDVGPVETPHLMVRRGKEPLFSLTRGPVPAAHVPGDGSTSPASTGSALMILFHRGTSSHQEFFP